MEFWDVFVGGMVVEKFTFLDDSFNFDPPVNTDIELYIALRFTDTWQGDAKDVSARAFANVNQAKWWCIFCSLSCTS